MDRASPVPSSQSLSPHALSELTRVARNLLDEVEDTQRSLSMKVGHRSCAAVQLMQTSSTTCDSDLTRRKRERRTVQLCVMFRAAARGPSGLLGEASWIDLNAIARATMRDPSSALCEAVEGLQEQGEATLILPIDRS